MYPIFLSLFLALAPASRTKPVYICQSSSAYAFHADSLCHGLRRCTHTIYRTTRGQAEQRHYRPCKICYKEAAQTSLSPNPRRQTDD